MASDLPIDNIKPLDGPSALANSLTGRAGAESYAKRRPITVTNVEMCDLEEEKVSTKVGKPERD